MGVVCSIATLGLYKIRYNNRSVKHRVCVCAVVALCVLMTLFLYEPNQEMIDYKTADIANSDPFVQMFDATINGRVNLDIPTSPELKTWKTLMTVLCALLRMSLLHGIEPIMTENTILIME